MIIPVEIKLTPTRTATPTSTATPTPTLTATPTLAGDLSTGYWQFVEPYQGHSPDPVPAPDTGTASVGANSMSGSYSRPDYISAFKCSWTWNSPGGMEKLVPGETLKLSMTLTDLGDWENSNSSSLIRFIKPYQTETVDEGTVNWLKLFVYRKDKGTVSQTVDITIPSGPPISSWNNRMGILSECWSAYGFGGYFERVYEWVPPGEDRTQIPTKVTPTKVTAEMVVNGLVLDDATQKPLAKAWVAMLLPGITAGDWQELEFPKSAVLAYGQSDSQGRFSLVDPVDMATPVYLERNIAYSVFAWLDGYQNMLADDLIIGDSQSSPVKLTITMQQR